MLDGHDDYKVGTNRFIDAVIKKEQLGNCRIIVTSRNTTQLSDVKSYMDIETVIHGFDWFSTFRYAARLFCKSESRADKEAAIEEAKELVKKVMELDGHPCDDDYYFLNIFVPQSGLSDLIRIPLFNQMLCVLSRGQTPLPKTKGGVILAFIKRSIYRENLKTSEEKRSHDYIETILEKLGYEAWKTLKQDSSRITLTEVGKIRKTSLASMLKCLS